MTACRRRNGCLCRTGEDAASCSYTQPLPVVEPSAFDATNPSHYRAASGLESFNVIEAFWPDKPYRWAPFKYLIRAGRKPGQDEVQDLRKAIWWIEREIAAIERR